LRDRPVNHYPKILRHCYNLFILCLLNLPLNGLQNSLPDRLIQGSLAVGESVAEKIPSLQLQRLGHANVIPVEVGIHGLHASQDGFPPARE
jgi:hypothetical protein